MDFRVDVRRIMRPDGRAWKLPPAAEVDHERGVVTLREHAGWAAFAHMLARSLGWYR